jgi:oxygen-independent coproporphyrinogen III oxidase
VTIAPLPIGAPLGLYIHIPFCSHICPYCDFNTYAGQDALIPRYVDALVSDIARQGRELDRRRAATIFFGGGTPSLLSGSDIARLIQACREAFDLPPDAEVTLEANPNSVDAPYFASLRDAGVNRLSIGVQTLHRRGLRTLGRQHEAADAKVALDAARAAGFANLSLDLIFGWPGQTLDDWRRDLDTILSWDNAPEHLSLYSLIVEPGTPMADAVTRGILSVLDDDATADLYELAIARMAEAGWVHYEVANWARPSSNGEPLASQHNLIYWQNGEYAGFGAGAHARGGTQRTMNHLLPKTYIDAIESARPGWSNVESLAPTVQMGETMMLGLRLLQDGIDSAAFATRHQITLDEAYGETIAEMVSLGLMERTTHGVRLTSRGLMVANDVCVRFL